MAGSALAPAAAQTVNLLGLTGTFRSQVLLAPVTEITNGTAEFNPLAPETILTYGGALTDRLGRLSVQKTGASASSLVLTGAGLNTYSGGTTLSAGTIQVSNNNALGTGALFMASNTTLQVAVSGVTIGNLISTAGNGLINQGTGTFTLNGNIEGAGSISTVNGGNLVLSGNNSFRNLGIGAGTVTVGTNTAAGVGDIALASGTTLAAGVSGLVLTNRLTTTGAARINQGVGVMTLSGLVEGPGSLTITGTGVLTLSAVNALTGPTTVSAGRLNVTGLLASSAVTVQTGATLSGTGTVGALTAQSGSTISPGATAGSVATMAVSGALTLAAGSMYLVDVTATGADRLSATGPASIAGNLVVALGAGSFTSFNQTYTLVSSSARTGTFAMTTVGTDGAAFAPTVIYDATSVILRLAPGSLVAAGGSRLTGNARNVAASFDTAVAGGYNPQPFFALYTQGVNLPNALGELSGELRAAERRVLIEDTRVVRETAFDRLNAGPATVANSQSVTSDSGDGKAVTVWLRGAGSWGTTDGDAVGSRFTTVQRGFLTGVDYAINDFKVGGMFHYTSTDLEFASLGTS